jgi:hypothetical protein
MNRPPTAAAAYLSAAEMVENVHLGRVSSPVISAITATAIPAAISPFSMAVAAFSSFKNRIILAGATLAVAVAARAKAMAALATVAAVRFATADAPVVETAAADVA